MRAVRVKIRRADENSDLPLPVYSTGGASGADLFADIHEDVDIAPGEIRLISCGIYLEIPQGYEAEIRPRSGLALKHGITLVNSPGTIDSDYRGLINLILINHGKDVFTVKRGNRLAQMVIREVTRADFVQAGELEETARAHGGFGHTGI